MGSWSLQTVTDDDWRAALRRRKRERKRERIRKKEASSSLVLSSEPSHERNGRSGRREREGGTKRTRMEETRERKEGRDALDVLPEVLWRIVEKNVHPYDRYAFRFDLQDLLRGGDENGG